MLNGWASFIKTFQISLDSSNEIICLNTAAIVFPCYCPMKFLRYGGEFSLSLILLVYHLIKVRNVRENEAMNNVVLNIGEQMAFQHNIKRFFYRRMCIRRKCLQLFRTTRRTYW